MQGFDTKRDDVLLFHILEIVQHTASSTLRNANGKQKESERKKEILRAMEKIQAKTENIEIALNGSQEASVREEIRAASHTVQTKKGKEEHPVHPPVKREGTRQVKGKEIPRWKGP